MIASIIAYVIAGIFFFVGIHGVWLLATNDVKFKGREGILITISFGLLMLSWGAAYLGGI